MTTPRRYVRVRCNAETEIYYAGTAWLCICRMAGASADHEAARIEADEHARTCPAVQAAMERDQLQQVIDTQLGGCSCHPDGDDYWDDRCALHGWPYRDWTEMADELDKELAKVQDMRDRYKAALESCEAAYATAQREWEERKTHFRADLDQLRADLDRTRAELDALQVKYTAASQARDAWRRVANRNRAELDRMRADRDRLRDRLNQINPLNKDNE